MEQLKKEQAKKNELAKQLLVAKDEEIARLLTAPSPPPPRPLSEDEGDVIVVENPEHVMAQQFMDMARIQVGPTTLHLSRTNKKHNKHPIINSIEWILNPVC